MRIYVLPLIIILLLSGCAKVSTASVGENDYIKLDSENRAIVIIKNDNNMSKYKVCSEPFPDAIATVAANIAGKYKDVNASIGFQRYIIDTYSSLKTERILEKSLHRLCELSINTDLSPTDIKEMYLQVMQVAQTIASAELANENTKQTEAVKGIVENKDISSADKQKFFKYLYENNIYPTIFDKYGNPQSPIINLNPQK